MGNNTYSKRIQRVVLHIERYRDAMPTLDELAGIAHFSPFHFHRIVKSLVRESVAAYIRRLALQKAAKEVSSSRNSMRNSITVRAFEADYESPEVFTRAFRAAFGVTPSHYPGKRGFPGNTHCVRVWVSCLADQARPFRASFCGNRVL